MTHFGKLATHDIVVPCLLLYEMGKIKDKNGTEVDIDRDFINFTKDATNNWIKKRHLLPFAKFITQWSKPVDEANAIPLIKNHKTDEVENLVGHSRGLLYTEEVDGVLALFTSVAIEDPHAKEAVVGELLRQISIGTRPDGSIKEISFVVNEAAPLCGLMLSEPTFKISTLTKDTLPEISIELSIEKDNKQLELAEELKVLQLAERELENIIIPNHMILSRMIKRGKIKPAAYDKLIKDTTPQTLELMERYMPSNDLGLTYGTNRDPEPVCRDELKFEEALAKGKNNLGIKDKNKSKDNTTIDMIKQAPSYEERRNKELKHILELAEYSPDVVAKYIKHELGEEVEQPKYKDTLLSEYLTTLKEVKNKCVQLGENLC